MWGCGPKGGVPNASESSPSAETVAPLVVESQPLVHSQGMGPWNLGMARYEVLQAFNCKRFIPERNSGGFQCSDWVSPMGPRRVSFVFDAAYRLSKLQLWIAEQDASGEASDWARSVWEALEVLSAAYDLTSSTHPELLIQEQANFIETLSGAPSELPFSLHVEVARFPDRGTRAWMTAIATPQGRFAFLFVGR